MPKLVIALSVEQRAGDPARLVACGPNFTVVVTERGVVWAWGEGRCGELGIGLRVAARHAPSRVVWPDDATACRFVTCGWAHVLAIDAEGNLLASHAEHLTRQTSSRCVHLGGGSTSLDSLDSSRLF